MTKRTMILGGLVALLVCQLGVPLSMICKREFTLREGRLYKFRTAPVDPYDAFRGRYVALGMDRNWVATTNTDDFGYGQRVYVTLTEDTNGFAQLSGMTHEKPHDQDYLRMRISHQWHNTNYFDLPFDRYYMNEKDAPAAERAYRDHSRRGKQDAYVGVRILRGFPVIEDLYVDDKPIREFLVEKGKE